MTRQFAMQIIVCRYEHPVFTTNSESPDTSLSRIDDVLTMICMFANDKYNDVSY